MKNNKFLQKGDLIKLGRGHTVKAWIPRHFVYANEVGDFTLTKTTITIGKDHNGLNTDYFMGTYVVTKTCTDGGGTGHGPGDVYPDGHHVFCKLLESSTVDLRKQTIEVEFYQSGCFNCMIKHIEPIGRAKEDWKIE